MVKIQKTRETKLQETAVVASVEYLALPETDDLHNPGIQIHKLIIDAAEAH